MKALRLIPAVLLLAMLAQPVLAEPAWIKGAPRYELTGATLFKLRPELPEGLEKALEPVRNKRFADEGEFRAALTALGADAEWVERFVGLATVPGGTFGIEPHGEGMTTLYVERGEPALDDNAFTSESWLREWPDEEASTITAEVAGGCLAVSEAGVALFSLCEPEGTGEATAVVLRTDVEHIVGLGQQFQTPGDTTVERAGFDRDGLNVMEGFNGGANGNTLFPIAYFDNPERPFALILDNRYQQKWNFAKEPYRLRVQGGDFKLHVLTGDTLAAIRKRFMMMAGRPPVPPKAAFGFWLSEYGFDNWGELDEKLGTLEANGFPVSGVVLDLQWFGGISTNSPTSRMGSLSWDREHFPDPRGKIKELADRGIGVMTIEESYVSEGLPEYAALAAEGALAHDGTGTPLLVNPAGNWWGKGGMIDWTEPHAQRTWHDYRRAALVSDGVIGHWTDLGEPEMVNPDFRYGEGLSEAQVHNSYNVKWLEGIADGYTRNGIERRPFMMSRSGGMGMQTLGAAMWSGDTASDFGSLAAQMPQQTHMMWSGIDYYGSDVGGFHRGALGYYPPDQAAAMDELYTQWLAYAALFEVPIRAHTENLCNCKETAPDRIGDVYSNYENLAWRQSHAPYYYSLAFSAWLTGEPMFPSLEYAFPDDPEVDRIGHVKMIGTELLAAAVAQHDVDEVDVYLPKGRWFDLGSFDWIESTGEWVKRSISVEGLYSLPVFAKDGAIVPWAFRDRTGLVVYGNALNRFEWYDDDGVTTAYQLGDYEHIGVAVDGEWMTLTRHKGTKLSPFQVVWLGIGEVIEVFVDGQEIPFEKLDVGARFVPPAFEHSTAIRVITRDSPPRTRERTGFLNAP